MSQEEYMSLTEARKRIFEIAQGVKNEGKEYILTERGKPIVHITDPETVRSWRKTVEVLKKAPHLAEEFEEAKQALLQHEYISLQRLFAEQGFVVADKDDTTYDPGPSRPIKKSKRRTDS